MDKNKLVLPVSILVGCVILGGFYYASEANKQASIERQQQADFQQKQSEQQAITEQNNLIADEKASCKSEAESNAINMYNHSSSCTGSYPSNDCNTGTYLVAQYNNAYAICLEGKGLK